MPTQQSIAEHLDLDQSAVSRLVDELGIDWKAASIDAIRVAYIRRLREQAAGRAANGDLQLAAERARLASEQADRVAMLNARTKRELAPVALLEAVLARVTRQIAGILEALPITLRRQSKSISPEDLSLIETEIARVRNLAASIHLELEDPDGHDRDSSGDPVRAEAA